MANKAEIVRGLDKYIQHWTKISKEDMTVEYKAQMPYLVMYWTSVRNVLCDRIGQHTQQTTLLKYGFWPQTRQLGDFMTDFLQDGSTHDEYKEEEPYIGILEGKLPRAYNVATDVHEGFYLFVRPSLDCSESVWLGRAIENPQVDHYCEVLIHWYTPCGRSKNVQQLYAGYTITKHGKRKLHSKLSAVLLSTVLCKPTTRRVNFFCNFRLNFLEFLGV